MTNDPTQYDATTAWHELLDGLRELETTFLQGDRAVQGENAVSDGYRMLATILGVGLDTYLFSDPARPIFLDTVTPFRRDRRWGGDNTDSYYSYVVIDPTRTYRITGQRANSVYFSLTIYNEPAPGAWSDRVIGIVKDSDLEYDAEGRFELMIGPERPEGYGGVFVELAPDAAVALTRDYLVDPETDQRVIWEIEAMEDPGPLRRTDADTAQALRSTLNWMRTMFAIVPLSVGLRQDDERFELGHDISQVANEFADPYPVPMANFGWSATDACYSFGSYDLAEDEALVITHRPPSCRFWNLIVWNQFMAGHNVTDGRTSINHGAAIPNSDGSVTVVVARTLLDHPNAISTLDQVRGNLAFRWFLPDEVPARPEVRLVKISLAPTAVS